MNKSKYLTQMLQAYFTACFEYYTNDTPRLAMKFSDLFFMSISVKVFTYCSELWKFYVVSKQMFN